MANRFISDIEEIANLKWTTPRKEKVLPMEKAVKVNNTSLALSTGGTIYVLSVDRSSNARPIDLRLRSRFSFSERMRRRRGSRYWVDDLLAGAVLFGKLSEEAHQKYISSVKEAEDRNYSRSKAKDLVGQLQEMNMPVPSKLRKLSEEAQEVSDTESPY